MNRKKLPVGVQAFSEIRRGNYYYVDKTPFLLDLIDHGKYFFLSRPRRFGKSLLVDTFRALFAGEKELFTGLYAERNWDWEIKYPVFNFSFAGGGVGSSDQLRVSLGRQLARYEKIWNVTPEYEYPGQRFADLIVQAHAKTGRQVVILIDEYDKPILDAIDNSEAALANRDALRDFYSVIKDNDAHVRFAFLTGVSKFSKAGIFSGLNNLRDITISPAWSAICGYTEADLDEVFAPELEGVDRQEVRRWYNGYNWTGEAVYNPFDILLFFAERTFSSYWFETGTPTFLVRLMMRQQVFSPNLDQSFAPETLLSSFDVDSMPLETLLFQTGYLTVKNVEDLSGARFFELTYPNREVYQSLNNCLVAALTGGDMSREPQMRIGLYKKLQAADFPALETHLGTLFSSIPRDWHRKNDIARYEGYYASVFYSHFAALGLDIRVEDATSRGRVDMTVLFAGRVYIFEFKVVDLEPKGRAMEQLLQKAYADKYLDRGEPVYLIGVEFSRETRELAGFEVREISAK